MLQFRSPLRGFGDFGGVSIRGFASLTPGYLRRPLRGWVDTSCEARRAFLLSLDLPHNRLRHIMPLMIADGEAVAEATGANRY